VKLCDFADRANGQSKHFADGLYSGLAYLVSERTQEIGIRAWQWELTRAT